MKKIVIMLLLFVCLMLSACSLSVDSLITEGNVKVYDFKNKVSKKEFGELLFESISYYQINSDFLYESSSESYTKKMVDDRVVDSDDMNYFTNSYQYDYDNNIITTGDVHFQVYGGYAYSINKVWKQYIKSYKTLINYDILTV